ncbi:MAG: hypothetical protein HQM10_14220 [Candidatus Riflebacteria bacterium]|nr:hypothetical protein [Candidatus Riflebacteria bacterium]
MNGQKIFFISLIVLSLAMGYDWKKNRPRSGTPGKKTPSTAQLINENLTVASGSATERILGTDTEKILGTDTERILGTDTVKVASETNQEDQKNGTSTDEKTDDKGETTKVADKKPGDDENDTGKKTDSTAEEEKPEDQENKLADENLKKFNQDNVFVAWNDLKKGLFQPSPFVKLIDDMKKEKEEKERIKAQPVVPKVLLRTREIIQAPFTGTIETDKSLIAIIDRSFYKVGQDFQGKKITRIDSKVITLDDASTTFLIPKKGVRISLSQDSDNFEIEDDYDKTKVPVGSE